jgi:hypothetical protein
VRAYRFSDQFVRDFRSLEPGMSKTDAECLDRLLVGVLANPEVPERFPSFYDPIHPSWLVRTDPFLVHFAFDVAADEVVFLNLFRRPS